MTTITIPEDLARQLAAVAALDGLTADEVAFVQLGDHVARRRRDIEAAYRALNGEPDPTAPPPPPAEPDTTPPEPPDGTQDDTDPSEPPRAGVGSSRDRWADYATSIGVDVTADMKRGDIIRAVDVHLGRVEPEPAPADPPADPPPAPEPDGAPATNGHTGPADGGDWQCEAARCTERKMAREGKFCPAHSHQVPRIAGKLRGRREFSKNGDAEREAVRRLIAGVR